MSTNLKKTALDAEAERYWSEYYADSGYGELWVRKIPKRVTAELRKRTASTAMPVGVRVESVQPLSTVIKDDSVSLEGMAVCASKEGRKLVAFVADFDHEGQLEAFDFVDVQ